MLPVTSRSHPEHRERKGRRYQTLAKLRTGHSVSPAWPSVLGLAFAAQLAGQLRGDGLCGVRPGADPGEMTDRRSIHLEGGGPKSHGERTLKTERILAWPALASEGRGTKLKGANVPEDTNPGQPSPGSCAVVYLWA